MLPNVCPSTGVELTLLCIYILVLEATVRLVDAGAYMNILNKDGHSPVYYLVMNQDVTTIARVLPYLLEKGADPSLGADLPLIAAASLKQPGITKMLLKHGVDVDQKNSRGSAALSTVLSGYFEISKGQEIITYLFWKFNSSFYCQINIIMWKALIVKAVC